MKVYNKGKIHVKSWCEDIESSAWDQIDNLSNLPFAYHHVAIMPDCHAGYGMPIGGVLAANDVIVISAVGVDIGCGVAALETGLHIDNVDKGRLELLVAKIKAKIPVGKDHSLIPCSESMLPKNFKIEAMPVVKQEYDFIPYQIGTLGGGK